MPGLRIALVFLASAAAPLGIGLMAYRQPHHEAHVVMFDGDRTREPRHYNRFSPDCQQDLRLKRPSGTSQRRGGRPAHRDSVRYTVDVIVPLCKGAR